MHPTPAQQEQFFAYVLIILGFIGTFCNAVILPWGIARIKQMTQDQTKKIEDKIDTKIDQAHKETTANLEVEHEKTRETVKNGPANAFYGKVLGAEDYHNTLKVVEVPSHDTTSVKGGRRRDDPPADSPFSSDEQTANYQESQTAKEAEQ